MVTKTLQEQNARLALLAATRAEFGIRVRVITSDTTITPAMRGRQVLYRFKNEDPDFAHLHFRLDPDEPNDCLWIIRGDTGLIATSDSLDDLQIDL